MIALTLAVAFLSQEATEVFSSVSPAVCSLVSDKSSATGFFVADGKYLVTANHFVEDSKRIELPGSDVRVLGVLYASSVDDIAILAVSGTPKHSLSFVEEVPRIGEKVFAIGNSLGVLENTLSDGLVSGIRQFDTVKLIQFTAPVSPGNSGGPLVNASGSVVGMVSFQLGRGQNVNFAVSAETLRAALESVSPDDMRTLAELQGQRIDISPKYKVGDTFTYRLAGDFEMMGTEAAMRGTTTNKIVEIQDDGSIVMESSMGSMVIQVKSEEHEVPPMPATRMTLNRNGEVITVSGGDPAMMEGFGRSANMNSFIWPEGPIRVGDTWTHEFKANAKTGGVPAKVTYKVLEETTVLGADALAIWVDFKETGVDPGMMKGVILIEIGTGIMLQTYTEMTNVTMAGSQFPISGASTVTLQR